jgi:ankyrin repeat protein
LAKSNSSADGEIEDLLRKHGGKVGAELPSLTLSEAADRGDLQGVKDFLDNGADVNAKSDDDKTPLDLAIQQNKLQILNLLRKHGGKTGEELKAEGK